MAKILEVKETELGKVAERLKEQGGNFVLLAASPEALKKLGGEIDPSNPTASAKTLAKLLQDK